MNINITDEVSPQKGISTFLNPYSYYVIKDSDFISRFDRVYCDGILFVLLMRIAGIRVNRVSFDMTSLAPIVFDYAVKNKLSIAFVGGETGVVEKAIDNFKYLYPDLNAIYSHSGFFKNDTERKAVLLKLSQISPDIVVVGMGAGYQEKFLLDLIDIGWQGCGYSCGGFLHQSASKVGDYYPNLVNKLNIRWMYRLYKEPKLAKRYFLIYPKSVLFFIKSVIFKRDN